MKALLIGLMALTLFVAVPHGVVAGSGNASWLSINRTGMNVSLLTIGMQGVDFSNQIINTGIMAFIPPIPPCYASSPVNLLATEAGPTSINLTWTLSGCTDGVIVRGSWGGWPVSPTDAAAIYSGSGTSIIIDDLDLGLEPYYLRVWGYNTKGYSAIFASLRVGFPIAAPYIIFIIGIFALACWKKDWIRLLLSLCLVIWGVATLPDDVKIAAPLIAVGSLLVLTGILQIKELGTKEA